MPLNSPPADIAPHLPLSPSENPAQAELFEHPSMAADGAHALSAGADGDVQEVDAPHRKEPEQLVFKWGDRRPELQLPLSCRDDDVARLWKVCGLLHRLSRKPGLPGRSYNSVRAHYVHLQAFLTFLDARQPKKKHPTPASSRSDVLHRFRTLFVKVPRLRKKGD